MEQPAFKLRVEDQKDTYGTLVIEPLRQGFGTTLGNALRRVMMGYLQGAAVTSVQISGIRHQFTTLKGMNEDIVDFILNVKQLRIAYKGEGAVTMRLQAKGPGEVTAAQIETQPGIEIANPDLVLAHLSDNHAKLDVTFTVESGVGYSPSDERDIKTLGVIPVDAIFSPVTRVNYEVSNTRVGRLTNYDKLTIQVWTDGTITPLDAVMEAAKIVRHYFNQLINPLEDGAEVSLETEEKQNSSNNESYKLTVEELELPTRIANALRKAGYGTVKDLVEAPRAKIIKVKNLGGKSIKIIEAALREKGVELPE